MNHAFLLQVRLALRSATEAHARSFYRNTTSLELERLGYHVALLGDVVHDTGDCQCGQTVKPWFRDYTGSTVASMTAPSTTELPKSV